MKTYNWRPFLDRWSADWADSPGVLGRDDAGGGADVVAGILRERWLGFPAAGEDLISALEERLGLEVALPPTYRSFLAVTDGWRPAGTGLPPLGMTEGVRWYESSGGRPELSGSGPDEGGSAEDEGDRGEHDDNAPSAGVRGRALQLALDSDRADVLLDPGDVNADGEWAAYLRPARSGGVPDRYESFMDLMQALFRRFHHDNENDSGFVNATTRELDADIEEARAACLRGADSDSLLKVFGELEEYGKARARRLRFQTEALLSGGCTGSVGTGRFVVGRPDDPLYARELLPLRVREALGSSRGVELLRKEYEGYGGKDREWAEGVLREMTERTFRYEPAGPFGVAVAAARERARWGDTEAAWHILADAVADWEPYHSDHLAPAGLLADPLLGPVITPERGRYILETPRAGGRTDSGRESESDTGNAGNAWDTGDMGVVDGLTWLTDEADQQGVYRFVLVRGVSPEDLAGRIGRGPLLAPSTEGEVRHRGDQDSGLGPVRVGFCGPGAGKRAGDGDGDRWSFGYEGGPFLTESFHPGRLSGLGESASRGTESVTVWCERGGPSSASPGTFHFSVAEAGERVYGFTVHAGETERWGTLPESLDPDELFPGSQDDGAGLDPDDEYEALAAVADGFGVSLPHFAIRHGRLHAVAARPWIRPPGPGGTYAVVPRPGATDEDVTRPSEPS